MIFSVIRAKKYPEELTASPARSLQDCSPEQTVRSHPLGILKPTVTVLRERLRWAAESRAGQPPPERGRSPLSAAAGPAPVLSFPKPRTRVDGEVLPVFTAARLCQKQKPPGVLGEVYKVLEKLGSFSP